MIGWLLGTSIGRTIIGGTAAFAVLAFLWWRVDASAYHRGYAARVTEEVAADARRMNDATHADDDARRCAADPDCRLRRDPYQRD